MARRLTRRRAAIRRGGLAVALVVAVGGIGVAPLVTAGSAAPVARHPVGGASNGCGKRPVPGPTAETAATGDVVQSLPVDGVTRSYRLAVPAGYRPSVATPLILLFHGSGSNAVQTSIYTRLPKRAARDGSLVATPDGLDGRWQVSAPGATTDDLTFVSDLIADLTSRYCVDRTRIYAAGISLGSEFSAIVGCTRRDHIAAVGLVAAEFLLRPCTGPLPVIAFHGTADPIVAYRSGATGTALPGIPVIGVEQNLSHWARLDRCSPRPGRRRLAPMVVRRTWSGCRGGSAVVLYSVLGGGHTWPGSPIVLPAGTFGATTEQIDATGLMLAFFGHHRLVPR